MYRNKLFSLISIVAILSLVLGSTGAADAKVDRSVSLDQPAVETRATLPNIRSLAERIEPPLAENDLAPAAVKIEKGLPSKGGPVKIVIELQDEPTTVVYANARKTSAVLASSSAKSQLAKIEQAQQALLEPLALMGAQVIYRVQRVYNGIAVIVDANRVAEIEKLPGVKAVHPLITKELDNWHSVPFIGAPELWDAGGPFGGLTGDGITVGVIDTGIDYIHTGFGGPGTPEAYEANDTTVITDTYLGNPLFPTAKVVGGWDFVGDDYDANPSNPTYQPIPHPDPDPMDCYGHGTHVAGTIAGYGVNADGSTYTGTYTATMDLAGFKIGPGVAPKALLYSLRVFGCVGSTDVTDLAIEWAVDPDGNGDPSDHLDVINMSLGSSYGSAYDSSAVAANNAALAGVIVVASAGNSYDNFYITGTPGAADRVISVAAADHGGAVLGAFVIQPPASISGTYPAVEAGFGPDIAVVGPVTETIVYPADQPLGCAEFNITNTLAISGHIALLDRGTCTFVTKVKNAQNAGAKAVLVANNAPGFPFTMGGSDPTITIPAQMTDQPTGNLIKSVLGSETITATLTAAYRNAFRATFSPLEDTIASFSSRGPRRLDSILKPDITAPGVAIFSVDNDTGTGGVSMQGTSMAAPHVAGAMALLREQHPTWSVEELKALVMNTAVNNVHVYGGATLYGPSRQGAGRITLPAAASSDVVAYNADAPYLVSLSFGAPEVVGTAAFVGYINVANKGVGTVTYTLAYSEIVAVPGVSYTFNPTEVVVGPGSVATVTVTLNADAALMKHTRDATLPAGRYYMSEAAGYLWFKSASAQWLRVPIYAAPRPASNMAAQQTELNFATPTASTVITLTGQDINNTGSGNPVDIVSLVAGFELQESSPDLGDPQVSNADLKYIGVTNNYRATNDIAQTTIYFGIATWGKHSSATAADAEFDIYIDTNLDGVEDYVVWNTNTGLGTSTPTDAFATVVYNLHTGVWALNSYINNYSPTNRDTAIFNSDVIIMPVTASALGLSALYPRFNYYVVSYSRDSATGDYVDISDLHSYSARTPGLDYLGAGTTPFALDLNNTAMTVRFNQAAYQANGSQGALLFHLHNATGNRAEVIPVNVPNYHVVSLLHTNDFHGQLQPSGSNPGMARTAAVINGVRADVDADNVALLDAGDMMQGSLLSNLFKGKSTIDVYNLVGYDAAAFGNHEFDWGQQVLISRTQEAAFPFLSANIVVSDSGSCATAGWTVPTFAKPWMTMTVGAPGNEVIVGLVGVTSQETPYITIASATAGLCFKDPAQSISHYYNDMLAAGAEVIVVLSHLGYTDGGYGYGFPVYGDQTLATKLQQASTPAHLIIGGHSHTDLAAPTDVNGTLVVQAHYNGRKVGRANIAVNQANGAVTINWERLVVSTTGPEDPAVKARINQWANDPWYQSEINRVIGYTNVDLVRNYNGDSLMGKFVNDAIYNDLNNDTEPSNDVDIVFNNPGGLRADILTGGVTPFTLTHGLLFDVLPFGNATLVGDMTGAQIQDLLNQSATLFKGALQVSGIRYTFYRYADTLPGPQPWAWGAYNITVKNRATGEWEPLVMTRTYRIATNEFLAPAGQDGFVQFKYVTNTSYWGDMLDGVERWVSSVYTIGNPYNETLDGRITRNGTDTYDPNDPNLVVPVTILHHNDSHGRLAKSGSTVGYTQLATLIRQERAHNADRSLLLNAGDQIQGDSMMYYYRTAFTGYASDGTPLPITMTVNPMMAVMNAMTYTAMTLGNHEFNFGNYVFTGTLKDANFPILQANVYDDGRYGLDEVPVLPHVTVTVPGPAGPVKVAVLGIGNHRVPNYELPSNIVGLSFTNPITETQNRAPALKAENDAVIALTHIGFTENPASVEVDLNVDTNLAAQTTGVDAIIGGHSHTNPATGFGPYKFLPTFVGAPDNTPVIINQALRYNTYLGQVVLGLLPKAGGGYEVVARAGRYQSVTSTTPEDPTIKAIVDPYVAQLAAYNNRAIGQTTVPLDALQAFTQETNAANLQADASVWELAQHGINVDFHLSGAMTNQKVAATATPTNPYTLTIANMFTLMPYENSLVTMRLNGPQLKRILERAYRNYYYYKYVPGYGGYSYYTTCMLDINAGNQITYKDAYPNLPNGDNVASLVIGGQPVDFDDADTYYLVSTVNYLAAGSCNFNDGGVTLWPLDQIVNDTQYYVRDAVINYIMDQGVISPQIEGRLQFLQSYVLTVNTEGQGSVEPAGGTFAAGEVVTLTATADPGWTFAGWSGDVTGTTDVVTITMDADKVVTATFTQNQYTLTVVVTPTVGGTVEITPTKTFYVYGEVVTLTAVPTTGWTFVGWSGDVTGTTDVVTVTMTSNKTVTATFRRPEFKIFLPVVMKNS